MTNSVPPSLEALEPEGAGPERYGPDPWTADRLDAFVDWCDSMGGIGAPACRAAIGGFSYRPSVLVDTTLDPFSEDYFAQQIALYSEIAGRALDQSVNEMTPVPMDDKVDTANPYGENNVAFISKHCRTVLTAMMVANLPRAARVLDMGAGWGLSSEMIAYTGARVTAVDISPDFCDLIRRRTARTGLPIEVIEGTFDTVEPGGGYDLIFFYECLHHAVRPWETLARMVPFLGPGGRVAFAGEPVNTIWWPHWGMRLDAESVYVMRKHGWFESGWSEDFICACLRRAGLEPTVLPLIGLDGREICVAHKAGDTATSPLVVPPLAPPPPPATPPLALHAEAEPEVDAPVEPRAPPEPEPDPEPPEPPEPEPPAPPEPKARAPWWRRMIRITR